MEKYLQNPGVSIFLVLVLIIFLVYRQVRPRKLSLKGLFIFPIIILYFIIQSFPTFHPTSTKLLEICISSIVSITFGFLACRQLHVYKGSSGKAMAKGSWTYFLWWLAAFVVKSILSVIFGESSVKGVSQFEILLPVFFLMTTRSAYFYWKTKKLGLDLH